MTEQEAKNGLIQTISKINHVKQDYDSQYMFCNQNFFREYMSTHLYPLIEDVQKYGEYLSESTIETLRVPDIWTGEDSIELAMWMYFFDNWINLTR